MNIKQDIFGQFICSMRAGHSISIDDEEKLCNESDDYILETSCNSCGISITAQLTDDDMIKISRVIPEYHSRKEHKCDKMDEYSCPIFYDEKWLLEIFHVFGTTYITIEYCPNCGIKLDT